MELLITNIIYVSYRLLVSAPIVKVLNKYMHFMLAVVIMAQLSFMFDTFVFHHYFQNVAIPSFLDYCSAGVMYSLRVLAAWYAIKLIWDMVKNYWVAVFIGAELTFICDYYIFHHLFS